MYYKDEGPGSMELLFPPCHCVMYSVSLLTSCLFTLGSLTPHISLNIPLFCGVYVLLYSNCISYLLYGVCEVMYATLRTPLQKCVIFPIESYVFASRCPPVPGATVLLGVECAPARKQEVLR